MTLAPLAAKLAHPLAEVRQRAVHLLASKAEAGLLSLDDMRLEPDLPGHLLKCAAEALPSTQLESLSLLSRLSDSSETSSVLVQLGAIAELHKIQEAAANSSAEAEEDAVAKAAATTAEKILHHPASALPVVSKKKKKAAATPPGHVERTPPAPLLSAGAAAVVKDSNAPSAPVSRSLNFAGIPSDESNPAGGAVSYGAADDADAASLRRAGGARLQLACPGWMQLSAPSLSRNDEQSLFEGAVRLQMADSRVLQETWCAPRHRSMLPTPQHPTHSA